MKITLRPCEFFYIFYYFCYIKAPNGVYIPPYRGIYEGREGLDKQVVAHTTKDA